MVFFNWKKIGHFGAHDWRCHYVKHVISCLMQQKIKIKIKNKIILGFLWNSYLSYTYSSLKLDIVYTILFVRPMHMLKTKKLKRFLWGVVNGVCGNIFCQIFNISTCANKCPFPITLKWWSVVPSTLVECHAINFWISLIIFKCEFICMKILFSFCVVWIVLNSFFLLEYCS